MFPVQQHHTLMESFHLEIAFQAYLHECVLVQSQHLYKLLQDLLLRHIQSLDLFL